MDEATNLVFGYPARVRAQLASSEDMLDLARTKHALDATIFDEYAPFFWDALISHNQVDAYFTRMAPSSLRNYAQDAEAGVSFQNSHRTDELGFGRSLSGLYVESGEDMVEVLASFYTVRGLILNGVNTDHLVVGMLSGIVKDVSIGFYGGEFRCSLCGRDMWRDWDCWHIPGIKYPKRDEKGEQTGEDLAIAWVENARLAEVSAVYEGASPGCAILKAQREAEAGRISPAASRLIQARYRIHLPEKRSAFQLSVADVELENDIPPNAQTIERQQQQEVPMSGKPDGAQQEQPNEERIAPQVTELVAEVVDIFAPLRTILSEVSAPTGDDVISGVRWMAQQLQALRGLADDGRAYRSDLIDQALAEGVRAQGAAFPQESYKAMLENASLDNIKRVLSSFKEAASQRFEGGRQTEPGREDKGQTEEIARPNVPPGAYRG